jgi:tripartite-type tricarboxylate transporter receptor subunit TctC
MRQIWLMLGVVLSICAGTVGAQAQGYPNRTIRVVVPYAPGGGVSILGQIVTNKMSEILKQPIIIDNRPGAGGNLGADIVAKSPPDGYTILLHTSAMSSASALYSKLPFDPSKDFIPVTMVISTQFVIAGSPKDPATNLTELAKEAKAKPGTLNFGSSGPGSSLHIFAEMFNNLTGIKMVHVPYRGDAPMVTALMSNDIQLAFLPQANGIANVQSNQIRGLGVTGTKRMDALPNVPTAAEQGIKGLEVGSWNAMFVPAGTPPEIVKTIQQAVAQSLADPKVREVLIQTGQDPVGDTPEQFAATFKADVARFSKVVEEAKIPKLD